MLQTDSLVKIDSAKAPIVKTQIVVTSAASTIIPQNFINQKVDSISVSKIDTSYLKCYNTANWEEFLSSKNLHNKINQNKVVLVSSIKADSLKSQTEFVTPNHSILYGYGMNNFIIVILFTALVLLAWTKIAFGKYLNQILRAVFTYSDAYKLFRDHNTLLDRIYFLLNAVFVISGGLFCFHLFKYLKSSSYINSYFTILYFCFGLIVSIYLFRFIIIKILGLVLNQLQSFNEYLHSTFLYFKVAGLFLLPISAFVSYVPVNYRPAFLYFGLFVILLLYLISVFRGTRIMLQKGILLFYWILYLCTVEFLPLLLLYKFFNTLV
jgi:hypothetical protein